MGREPNVDKPTWHVKHLNLYGLNGNMKYNMMTIRKQYEDNALKLLK